MSDKPDVAEDFIVFSLGHEGLAISSSSLLEVRQPVQVSVLPLVPDFIDGLVHINGNIIPQIDLARLIFDDDFIPDVQCSLLIVVVNGHQLALKVGLIQEPVTVAAEDVEACLDASDYFTAAFRHQDALVKIVDISCLQDIVKAAPQQSTKPSFLGEVTPQHVKIETVYEYLFFSCAGQHYAVQLEDIYEVVDLDRITIQPGSPAAVVGVGLIRERPVLIVSLAQLLRERSNTDTSAAPANAPLHDKANDLLLESQVYSVLLMRRQGIFCALLVDDILAMELIDERQIKSAESTWFSAIIDDQGQAMAQALHCQSLFDEAFRQTYSPYMPSLGDDNVVKTIPQQELLCFNVGSQRYALPVDDVRHVLSDKIVQPLPEAAGFVVGALDYDGAAIPVIDLRSQLGSLVATTGREFIIIRYGNENWALSVDAVEAIVSVDKPSIDYLAMPDESDAVRTALRCVQAYVSVQGELLSILNADVLCQINMDQLKAIAS